MIENYSKVAANWWVKTIKSSEKGPIRGLDLFQEKLSFKIKSIASIKGSMIISTYGSSSNFLDEIANDSGLNVNIPSGYEMRILFNNVFVYNSYGELVEHF